MMLDNQQMSDFMASKGFHSDGQNVLRGMQTCLLYTSDAADE